MKNKLFVDLKKKGHWPKPNQEAMRLGRALSNLEDLSNDDKKSAAAIINSYIALFRLSQAKRLQTMREIRDKSVSTKKELN